MAHPKKKPWIKPEVKHFESLEELSNFYRSKASLAELQKLEELLDQARINQAPQTAQRKLGRKSNG